MKRNLTMTLGALLTLVGCAHSTMRGTVAIVRSNPDVKLDEGVIVEKL